VGSHIDFQFKIGLLNPPLVRCLSKPL
jgi:hypothetical protein